VHDGTVTHQAEGRELDWPVTQPGKYRIEAEVDIQDAWIPWVYTNPIEILSGTVATARRP